jgi:hypothetical protein
MKGGANCNIHTSCKLSRLQNFFSTLLRLRFFCPEFSIHASYSQQIELAKIQTISYKIGKAEAGLILILQPRVIITRRLCHII